MHTQRSSSTRRETAINQFSHHQAHIFNKREKNCMASSSNNSRKASGNWNTNKHSSRDPRKNLAEPMYAHKTTDGKILAGMMPYWEELGIFFKGNIPLLHLRAFWFEDEEKVAFLPLPSMLLCPLQPLTGRREPGSSAHGLNTLKEETSVEAYFNLFSKGF